MTEPVSDAEQPDQVPVPPPPVTGSIFGEQVQYESDEAKDHWNDAIWGR